MTSWPRILLATNNPGKLVELRVILSSPDWKLVSPAEIDIELSTVENGSSYAENATIKAVEGAAAGSLLTLADDSGIEIDALGGAPGYLSARYLGETASYEERFRAILGELAGLPAPQRSARFRCVIAIARPGDGAVRTVEGVCEGLIAETPQGDAGFGYDPIFYLPDLGKTMAQLTPEEKNAVSHRARAARAALPILKELTNE
ncbi:MAG TPA: RdgB/HAM1 family non-canonical purine NTP pyrophosphatase [Dehalococcoidia bacterium]|nr:RdgB/HAM1 family non-canonical purine NTP pyrophosphatase [Dehalococcoidia bacterium]